MKKIFVTGGAGFLGYHVINYLKDQNWPAQVYDIEAPDPKEYPIGTDFFQNDVRDYASLKKAMTGADAVIHAAAALPLWSAKDIMTTNVDGTRNTLRAASELGISQVIFISSTAVYGIPKKHPLFENDPMVGVGPYGKSKIEAEKICEEYRSKLCVTVIRPKTFIGPTRLGVFSILYDWVASGKRIPLIGNGHNLYQLLDVEDLCAAIFLALNADKEKANQTFNIGAKEFRTVREDIGALCEYAKSGARPMSTPAPVVKFFLRIFEILHLSPLYRWIYGTANKDSYVSTKKLEETLGWQPKYSNTATLIRSYEWFLAHRTEVEGHSEGVTHRVSWKQGILRLIKKVM